jgi:hypothetical protein
MMDWFPAVMALIGAGIAVGAQELRFRRERKDKYKDMVFEKRLDAHQEVYYRLRGLLRFMLPHRLMQEGGVKALGKEISECDKCVARNALYLARDSRREIIMFLEYARKRGKRYIDEEWVKSVNVRKETEELVHNMAEVLNSVEKGIGVKYLPEEKMRLENSFIQEIYDETVDKAERLARKQKE